ncbi:MAG: hypothetical protein MJA83_05715 [Gammaproteobacteria bacterium]|nr:hypothetical protein [Gammaproteobacteria bacterium]
MADEIIRTYTAGDTSPNLVRTVPAATGISSLTGGTVRLRIDRPGGITLEKTITEVAGPDGHIDNPTATPPGFFFTFLAADLEPGNLQRAEIEYVVGASEATERDIFFNVGEALG